MKPDFALTFSEKSISLLYRSSNGWIPVGDVDLDVVDLGDALADLKIKAYALSATGGQVRLVIPNDQIKYLKIADGGQTGRALQHDIRIALNGTTPYAVHELCFDWSHGAGHIHVAAVAHEALVEAETFAINHHFDPVCFVAKPPEGAFVGEVFFGPATGWRDAASQKDAISAERAVLDHPAEDHSTGLNAFPDEPSKASCDPLVAELVTSETSGALVLSRVCPSPVPRIGSPATTVPVAARVRLGGARRSTHDSKVAAPVPQVDPVGDRANPKIDPAQDIAAVKDKPADHRIEGKPRFLGLMLTLVLLIFLLAVAVWAIVFQDGNQGRFFAREFGISSFWPTPDTERRSLDESGAQFPVPGVAEAPSDDDEGLSSALPPPDVLTPTEAQVLYAATGIWRTSPEAPPPPSLTTLNDLHVAFIDPRVQQLDAVALPGADMLRDDPPYLLEGSPVRPETEVMPDPPGLVVATPEGRVNPDGVRIFAGRPPVVPPIRAMLQSVPTAEAIVTAAAPRSELVRPRARPTEQIDSTSATQPAMRPPAALRPTTQPDIPLADEDEGSRPVSGLQSVTPVARPPNFAQIVASTRSMPLALQNTLDLIGVYGKPPTRRALVRLSNGRFQKVNIGDPLDGGRVDAIGDSTLRYSTNGRIVVLNILED